MMAAILLMLPMEPRLPPHSGALMVPFGNVDSVIIPITDYRLPNGLIKVRRRWGQRHPQGANSGSNGKLNSTADLIRKGGAHYLVWDTCLCRWEVMATTSIPHVTKTCLVQAWSGYLCIDSSLLCAFMHYLFYLLFCVSKAHYTGVGISADTQHVNPHGRPP
jgi:hypothetical protein